MQSTLISVRQKHEGLARRLEEFSAAALPGHLSLALQLDGDPLFVDYAGPGTLRTVDGGQTPKIAAGCLAKPVTASLLAHAVDAGYIDWTSQVEDVLGVRGTAASNLAGITISHLMNHTHGLDASMIKSVPRTPHDYICATALCEQLTTGALSAPGELYSYGNAGAWLAGAALEHVTDAPYSRLLSASLRFLLKDVVRTSPPSSLCPATGGSLALTMAEWLSFAVVHANSGPLSPDSIAQTVASLRSSPVSLPGWSPSERAACLGWKYYGEGWFGHTAYTRTEIAFLRFNPGDHTAVVMSAHNAMAPFAFSCLFRDYFPELKNLKFPRRLTVAETASLPLASYPGEYARAKTRIEVDRTDTGGLSFTVDSDEQGLRVPPQMLQAAENDIFFPDGKRPPGLPFIQFLRSTDRDSFSYLWNGRHLWKRR